MNIALDLRFVNDHFPGIGRYAFSLASAFAMLDGPHRFIFIVLRDAQVRRSVPNTRYNLTSLLRSPKVRALAAPSPFSVAGQIALPALLRLARADVYHTPYHAFPYTGLPCPVVVTLYDIIPRLFPRESSLRARLFFDLSVRMALHAAQRIVTLSQHSRADLARVYHVPAARIDVVYGAADERFRPTESKHAAAIRARHQLPETFALCVTSDKPHKNVDTLVKAWRLSATAQQSDAPWLILAGHRYRGALAFDHPRIRDLGPVAEADLPALYGSATLFVYPSRYEGFGLTPLEAMACGTPVICSHAGSLTEVVGDAALLVDPDDPQALAEAIDRAFADPTLRASLRAAGLARAASFSWHRAAQEILAVYERV
ncbi:glycosyltransferase family 4 protein [Roseiflexus castenholzii]|jgi:alpha-1,3-rhamnosyl/mannosyltransferase|uniref:Glycosyl transferase group 1 n=1 Tax=Roseiflexus castenholzii (strain DSM 13941 / HLO8) TaxID=383372 RepID=A7NI69_ROSCS|nr:glycosyltransferase family 1 protein [Roseiflexus castenholzii]ABU57169.1 glycosyl transferase group 1 [Roseiflexus castenholzii DSM 13941]